MCTVSQHWAPLFDGLEARGVHTFFVYAPPRTSHHSTLTSVDDRGIASATCCRSMRFPISEEDNTGTALLGLLGGRSARPLECLDLIYQYFGDLPPSYADAVKVVHPSPESGDQRRHRKFLTGLAHRSGFKSMENENFGT